MRRLYTKKQVQKIAQSSGTATNGQVLTADGNGGASWQNAGGGTTLYKHNINALRRFGIISTSNTPVTNADELKNLIKQSICIYFEVSTDTYYNPIIYVSSNNYIAGKYISGTTISSVDFCYNSTDVDDTVTEL